MEYLKTLCYTKERGIYVDTLLDSVNGEFIIFREFNKKGYKHIHFSIPDENFEVRIESNFDYCNSSYLYAIIKSNGNLILDFDKSRLNILSSYTSVEKHSVVQKDWDKLFEKIIIAYHIHKAKMFPTAAIDYIDTLVNLCKASKIDFISSLNKDKITTWSEDVPFLIFLGNKTRELIDNIQNTGINDKIITEHCLNLCKEYLVAFNNRKFNIKTDDSKDRLLPISNALLSIHKYMHQKDKEKGLEFFKLCFLK